MLRITMSQYLERKKNIWHPLSESNFLVEVENKVFILTMQDNKVIRNIWLAYISGSLCRVIFLRYISLNFTPNIPRKF